jgi:hypothetical protein
MGFNKLADLGAKLGDLAIPVLLTLDVLVEYPRQLLDRLAFPGRNLRRVQFASMALCQRGNEYFIVFRLAAAGSSIPTFLSLCRRASSSEMVL